MEVEFLSVEDVIAIHQLQIERFGGSLGLRDPGLLESAVAQAEASFGERFVHATLLAMAGAYLFHLVKNHAFIDGNKRIGLAAALVFLDLNGVQILRGTEDLYSLTMAVAEGRADKAEVTSVLERLA
jgi:death on curing protein